MGLVEAQGEMGGVGADSVMVKLVVVAAEDREGTLGIKGAGAVITTSRVGCTYAVRGRRDEPPEREPVAKIIESYTDRGQDD